MNNIKKLPVSQIVSLYQQDHSLKELQLRFNLKSYGPIKRILKENNIPIRKRGHSLRKNHLHVNENYFGTIDSSEKAYWLGFIVADGHVQKDGNKLSLISKDKDVIEKFKKAVESEHAITTNNIFDNRTNKTYTSYSIQISSKHFVQHLIKQGVTNAKSSRCNFPNVPESLYPHFIRGLFDGDGCICFLRKAKKPRLSLIATDSILIFIQNYLMEKFNFSQRKFSVVSINQKAKNSKLHIDNLKDQLTFLNFIYQNSTEETRLSRKYNLYQELIVNAARPCPHCKKLVGWINRGTNSFALELFPIS